MKLINNYYHIKTEKLETALRADIVDALRAKTEFETECRPEDLPLEGNILASGDDAEDRRAEQSAREQLESGNEWAWCSVRVIARLGEFEGDDHLGGCSYASQADFERPGDYYDDMRDIAFENLLLRILETRIGIKKLGL